MLFFSNFADQRLYRVGRRQPPRPITPEADALRYADLCVDARRWPAVVRARRPPRRRRAAQLLVASRPGRCTGWPGRGRGPRLLRLAAPEPRRPRLAWLAWNHPNMPWDGTELWVAELDAQMALLASARHVAGGRTSRSSSRSGRPTACCTSSPTAAAGGTCTAGADGGVEALCPMEAEFGKPQWDFGMSRPTPSRRRRASSAAISRTRTSAAGASLDTAQRQLTPIDTPFTDIGSLTRPTGACVFIGGSPRRAAAVVPLDLDDGARRGAAPRQRRSRRCRLSLGRRRPSSSPPRTGRRPTPSSTRRGTATSPRRRARSRRCWS